MKSPIVLLTDFGSQDPFVGVLKGALLCSAPAASVIDLCHEVPPQDVRTAALFLRQSTPYFPNGTIFVSVVDPGVGSSRRILFARTQRHMFLAPDNGLLSWLPDPVREWRVVENNKLFSKSVSATFHGRDIFAPVAGRLFRGLRAAMLGPKISDPIVFPFPQEGVILSIDRFGNAVTSIERRPRAVAYKGREILVRKTYADVGKGDEVAVFGSSGLIELCVREGSFAEQSSARLGDAIEPRD